MRLSQQMQRVATKLIDKFGDSVVLQEMLPYDPNTGSTLIGREIKTKAVFESVNDRDLIPGVVELTDSKVILRVPYIDKTFRILQDNNLSKECSIIQVKEIGFQDELIIYELIVRCTIQ